MDIQRIFIFFYQIKIKTKGFVNIITVQSPLFATMKGMKIGDEFSFNHNNKKTEYYIADVQ